MRARHFSIKMHPLVRFFLTIVNLISHSRLSANIAECLKSLFVLFAGRFLKHAAMLLSNNNTFVTDSPHELLLPDESSRIELVEAILLTLHRVFSYDAHNFVNQNRFELLAQPLVNQVENTIGTQQEYEDRARRLIVPCIASFVSAIPDDSLHKQLVYQILLKTRHAKSYVRSTALNSLVRFDAFLREHCNLDDVTVVVFFLFVILCLSSAEIARGTSKSIISMSFYFEGKRLTTGLFIIQHVIRVYLE